MISPHYFVEENDDWNKLTEMMTPDNCSKDGIMEYSTLAQCMGNYVFTKYQVCYIFFQLL